MDKDIYKRLADWCEKVSVASFAVGVFQLNKVGIFLSALSLLTSIYLQGVKK